MMNEHLISKNTSKQSFVPDGQAANIEVAAKAYDLIIDEHPIDIQLLGLGRNGHIGFNEPGSDFNGGTQKVALTQSTIDANARFFAKEEDVPTFAYSMGIGSILKSKKILLLAFGEGKADAVQKMIEGPATEDVPASALQKHADVTIMIDKAAASKLSK